MIEEEWSLFHFFHQNEEWGDPSKMSFEVVYTLDQSRALIHMPFTVTSGTQGHHAPESEHYEGRAVDFKVKRPEGVTLCDVFIDLSRFEFTGIGIYPHWSGGGGFHVEYNPLVKVRKLWMGIYVVIGTRTVQKYVELNSENLLRFGAMTPKEGENS